MISDKGTEVLIKSGDVGGNKNDAFDGSKNPGPKQPKSATHHYYSGVTVDKVVIQPDPEGINSKDPTVRLLSKPGAVNFDHLFDTLSDKELDEKTLEDLRGATISKVGQTIMSGNFSDLRGASKFMEKIGVKIEFPDEFYKDINQLLPRLSELSLTLLGISQPAVVGEYNLSKARDILKQCGFKNDELLDDNVIKILNLRHVLIALKEQQVKESITVKKLMPGLLESGK